MKVGLTIPSLPRIIEIWRHFFLQTDYEECIVYVYFWLISLFHSAVPKERLFDSPNESVASDIVQVLDDPTT